MAGEFIVKNGLIVSGSTLVSGSVIATSFTGSFSGSFAGVGASNQIVTGSVSASLNTTGNFFTVSSGSNNFLTVSASRVTINSGSLTVSQSVNAYNVNVGTPTSNAWQSGLTGSYFNNFTSQTDTSEILRFIAGLLSQSAPDASPNTKTFASTTQTYANNGTATIVAGYVPQSTINTDILYLISKGFTQTGSTLFSGKTIYNNSAYSINYSSVAGGSTIVSSSADAQLFGLGVLTSGGPTQFNVSGTINWFYSDNNAETSIATSQSQTLLSNSSFGTTNGLTLAKINTSNPAVIPSAYQDGKFATVFSNGLYNGGRSFTSVSSSGWYHISSSIAISTGSSAYSVGKTTSDRIFWAPVTTLNTNITNSVPTIGYVGTAILTATSRSLSGAPYLLTATFATSASVTGAFDPLYAASTTVSDYNKSDALITLAGTTAASTVGGTVQTANAIYDSTGVTPRVVGTIPTKTDIVRLTGSISFDALNAGLTNIASTGLGTTTFTLLTRGVNNAGTQTTVSTQTLNYHSASTFGQPLASGSMAYYGRTSQTYDGGTLAGQVESFGGEAFRIQLSNAVTTFTGTAWDTSYGLYTLGAKDLQVKPGFLVKPGGTYKYWLNDPSPSDTFKYYVRRYQRASVLTSFTLNVGKTLVAWDDTTTANSVAVGIIFESAKGGASNCRLFDPVYANGSRGTTFASGSTGTNPFVSPIDYYGAGGAVASTTYTITVQSATNMTLNGSAGSDEIYVIIRYNGDPAPVTSLTVSGT
jgi:hypothetical protein